MFENVYMNYSFTSFKKVFSLQWSLWQQKNKMTER